MVQRITVLALIGLLALADVASAETTEQLLARAQQGDGAALVQLRMRLSGSGEERKEAERVVEGYRQDSIDGEIAAQFEFGFLLEQGLGIPRDYRQAEGWYRKAAGRGHAQAQFRLGRMYFEGLAVPPDNRQAYVWLAAAAAGGVPAAAALQERAATILAPADLGLARAEARALIERLHKG